MVLYDGMVGWKHWGLQVLCIISSMCWEMCPLRLAPAPREATCGDCGECGEALLCCSACQTVMSCNRWPEFTPFRLDVRYIADILSLNECAIHYIQIPYLDTNIIWKVLIVDPWASKLPNAIIVHPIAAIQYGRQKLILMCLQSILIISYPIWPERLDKIVSHQNRSTCIKSTLWLFGDFWIFIQYT